jgi:hypothetical protein
MEVSIFPKLTRLKNEVPRQIQMSMNPSSGNVSRRHCKIPSVGYPDYHWRSDMVNMLLLPDLGLMGQVVPAGFRSFRGRQLEAIEAALSGKGRSSLP